MSSKDWIAFLKPEGEMRRTIIDSGDVLVTQILQKARREANLDKMRYNSYNGREGEILQERNHSV